MPREVAASPGPSHLTVTVGTDNLVGGGEGGTIDVGADGKRKPGQPVAVTQPQQEHGGRPAAQGPMAACSSGGAHIMAALAAGAATAPIPATAVDAQIHPERQVA